MKKIAIGLCLLGWALVAYHVWRGYGFEHAVGFIGFTLAGLGHLCGFTEVKRSGKWATAKTLREKCRLQVQAAQDGHSVHDL